MLKETRLIVGPHSYGLTVQLAENVTVYVGMPPPEGVMHMTEADAERQAKRSAVRALKLAILHLEDA